MRRVVVSEFLFVLGSGKRLFAGDGEPAILKLAEVKPLPSGTLILTYHRHLPPPVVVG